MVQVRSRHARRVSTGKRAAKSRRARRKVAVERHYHRRYAGVSGTKRRPTRKSAKPHVVAHRKPRRRLAVTPKPRTHHRRFLGRKPSAHKRRISPPKPKTPPISAASYLSMF